MLKKFLNNLKANAIRYIIMLIALGAFGYASYEMTLLNVLDEEGKKTNNTVADIFLQRIDVNTNGEIQTGVDGEQIILSNKNDGAGEYLWKYDYDLLLTYNDSALGYIRQGDGEYINYPILQHTDNEFYLNHTADKAYNRLGSIYCDYRIKEGLNAKNPIIYGHRMGERTGHNMFGSLVWYLNEKGYAEEHPTIDIYIGEDHYIYYVFACYETDAAGSDTYQYEFASDEEFLAYIDKCKARSTKKFPQAGEIKAEDNIITLSTCTVYHRDKRTIIQLVRRDKVEDEVTEQSTEETTE